MDFSVVPQPFFGDNKLAFAHHLRFNPVYSVSEGLPIKLPRKTFYLFSGFLFLRFFNEPVRPYFFRKRADRTIQSRLQKLLFKNGNAYFSVRDLPLYKAWIASCYSPAFPSNNFGDNSLNPLQFIK